ncbi:MAG TPA: DUF2255 family protein [Acidimicrobiales bacterium]|nr:DUF2255 family protein [Acidimicrobiales bacterium]
MSNWTDEELERIGNAEELQLASRREDGSLRRFTTMWVVRVADQLFVRSAGGPHRPWYRHALASKTGRVRTGDVETDVEFLRAEQGSDEEIDSQYHAKYDRYGPSIVDHVTGPVSVGLTVRLIKAA